MNGSDSLESESVVNLPQFVKSFTDGRVSLCKGLSIDIYDQELNTVAQKFDLLIDYQNETLVRRSQRCKFAVSSDEGQVRGHS